MGAERPLGGLKGGAGAGLQRVIDCRNPVAAGLFISIFVLHEGFAAVVVCFISGVRGLSLCVSCLRGWVGQGGVGVGLRVGKRMWLASPI